MYVFVNRHSHNPTAKFKLSGSGDLRESRERIKNSKGNLRFLLENRLSWVSDLHNSKSYGLEFGAGAGATKLFFPAANITLTDILDNDWLDVCGIDAENSPFPDSSFDYLLVNNVLHHLPHPMRFLREAQRILKPGGKLYIQEYHSSLLGRLILKLTNHESFDSSTNALETETALSSESDPWDSNCDVARQLFDSAARFEAAMPEFKVEVNRVVEALVFLNSGGVVVEVPHISLGTRGLALLLKLDRLLNNLAPNIFGLQRQVLLRKL